MKAVVNKQRFIYIAQPGLDVHGGMSADNYKCRACVADPLKFSRDTAKFSLHDQLSKRAPCSGDDLLCHDGFWVRDTKAGRADGIAYLLELS